MKKIVIDIFETEKKTIKPNYIFHRPTDKLHSRCIEYPWASSKLNNSKIILDVGSAKSDKTWLSYLIQLNKLKDYEIHATDYDSINIDGVNFKQSDVRKLPYKDNYFDLIFAISVIEHIGLNNNPDNNLKNPKFSKSGDFEAFKELIRVLKPNGRIILTIPYSNRYGDEKLIFGNYARCYNWNRLSKFSNYAFMEEIQFYEYDAMNKTKKIKKINTFIKVLNKYIAIDFFDSVIWKLKNKETVNGVNKWHTDCVACGIWRKRTN